MERFGKTLLFLFLILIFVIGAQGALKISVPYLRTLSGSLASFIESTSTN